MGESSRGADDQAPRRLRLGRVLRTLFVVAGFSFLAIVVARAVSRTEGLALPSWPRVGVGFLLAVVSLAFLFWGWRALIPEAHGPRLAASFYLSQLGKYIPGAVWQVVAQAGLAARAGVTWRRAATFVPVHAVASAAAGGTIGGLVGLLHPDLAWPLRALAVGSFAFVLALDRRVTTTAVRLIARVLRRTFDADAALPPQHAILRCYARTVGTIAALSALFTVMFAGAVSDLGTGDLATVFTGFALAWTVGYIIVPLPSGVGGREAALLLLLSTFADAEDIVTISVVQRLVFTAAEVALVFFSALLARLGESDKN